MRMPRKMGDKAYQEMLEARPDRTSTSRWLPTLQEWSKNTPPPPRRQTSNPLLLSRFRGKPSP
jgi:hypothetical protein